MISGTTKPSKKNQAACDAAVNAIFSASKTLLDGLVRTGPVKDRATEREKARAKKRPALREGAAAGEGAAVAVSAAVDVRART